MTQNEEHLSYEYERFIVKIENIICDLQERKRKKVSVKRIIQILEKSLLEDNDKSIISRRN
jgi:hypothetical protein